MSLAKLYTIRHLNPKAVPILVMLVTLCALSGCGTIYSSLTSDKIGYQTIQIHTNEKTDVLIYVDDQPTSDEASSILLSKNRDAHFVTIKKDGFNPVTQYFSRDIRPVVAIFDTIFFAVPLLVDLYTNEIYSINPQDIRINLRKELP